MKRSVVMAAYNGEKFLKQQLESVLSQLDEADEVVISVDPGSDRTRQLALDAAQLDKRVMVLDGPGEGVIRNFEHAIKQASGDLIFLCDQDDVWLASKVRVVTEAFEDQTMLVLHDAVMGDENLQIQHPSYFAFRGCKPGFLRNYLRNSFIGCCMAFRKELKPHILPFPEHLPMHDQWIGLLATHYGKVKFLDQKLLCYRRHGNNVSSTSHAGTVQMMKWRAGLMASLLCRMTRGKGND